MPTKYRLSEIEKERGSLHTVIPALLEKLGTQKAVADELKVAPSTVSLWLRENGYVPITRYVRSQDQAS